MQRGLIQFLSLHTEVSQEALRQYIQLPAYLAPGDRTFLTQLLPSFRGVRVQKDNGPYSTIEEARSKRCLVSRNSLTLEDSEFDILDTLLSMETFFRATGKHGGEDMEDSGIRVRMKPSGGLRFHRGGGFDFPVDFALDAKPPRDAWIIQRVKIQSFRWIGEGKVSDANVIEKDINGTITTDPIRP